MFAHNWIHDEAAPVDASIEVLSAPLSFPGYNNPGIAGNPWVSWFFDPRINVGGMINTAGKTSYAFTGFTWRIPIYRKFFFEGEFGGAVNNAPDWHEPGRVDMGCALTFREVGRIRLPVQRKLGSDRVHRARLPRQLLHAHQPRPHPGRGEDRLQILRPPGAAPGGDALSSRTSPRIERCPWRLCSSVPARRRSPFPPLRFSSNDRPLIEAGRRPDLPAHRMRDATRPGARAAAFFCARRRLEIAQRPDRRAPRGPNAQAHRHLDHPHHRRRPDHHRPGLRVRLFRDAGLQGAARGGLPNRPDQFESGHHHDRPGHGGPDLYRADHPRDRRQDHRQGALRDPGRLRASADHGRPDGAELRARA